MTRRRLACALVLAVAACGSRRATPEDCTAILDRIVSIELYEQGYRDPVLLERKRAQALERFGDHLPSCIGRRIPAEARRCIDRASDTETLVHDCLRL